MDIVIALGGNIGDTVKTFTRSLELIHEKIGEVVVHSPWYESEPLLHPDTPVENQDNFKNGVALVVTEKDPIEVMEILLEIEKELGRKRTIPWAPRVIDLDFISAEDLVLNEQRLTLPHPHMHQRDFVLRPMVDVSPDWMHPVLGKTAKELYEELPTPKL